MTLEGGTEDIKGTALRGGLAKLLGQGGTFIIRLAFMAIVARLLAPEDFGLVAMVTVITAVLELFATAGLSAASVQRSKITEAQISTLFWINLFVGAMLTLLCLTIAPFVAAFYHEPRLFWVTVAMGAGFFFNAAGVQHLALMQRQLRYTALASIEFLAQLGSLSIGVAMAASGYGYWALVAAAVSAPAILTVSLWASTAWVPGRPRRKSDVLSLVHFGGTVTISGVVSYISYNFDKFILGRVWGATAVGQYSVASQLVNTPTANINMAIGGVLFSVLSRLQHDEERFKSYLLKAYSLIVSMTLPITIFAGVFAVDIIRVVLGPQWSESAEIFRLLVPAVLVFGLINPLGWFLWSSGRHVRCFKISLVILVLVVSACLAGLAYGPTGVAIGFSTAMVIWLVPHVVWTLQGSNVRPFELMVAAARPLFSAVVAVALAYAAHRALPMSSSFLNLIVEAGVMGVAYPVMLLFVMGQKDLYLDLLETLGFRLTRAAPQLEGVPSSP